MLMYAALVSRVLPDYDAPLRLIWEMWVKRTMTSFEQVKK